MSRRKRYTPRATRKQAPAIEGYQELLAALSRADEKVLAQGGTVGQATNLAEAGDVLNRYPQLVRYLTTVSERQQARAAQTDLLQLAGSPTGSHPQVQPLASYWSGTKEPIGVPNARVMRDLADKDPWVRAAINVRRQQIGRADIAVVPANEMKPYNKTLMRKVQKLLDQPNEMRDSYRSLIEPVIEDILVLDRGVITKDMTVGRQPQGLYYEDGSTISIYPAWDGKPTSYRYLYQEPGSNKKVPLRNDECIVFMACPASHRYGLSPVQVLYETIQSDLAATKSAKDMVDMKPPPHLLQILGATDSQLRNLRTMYEAEIMGRKELFLLGGSSEAKLFSLTASAKDNQWLEWQIYLVRKIAAVFQVSPQQLGVTFDINKSTGDVQQQIFEDTGLIPLLLLLEEQLNRELLADFAPQLANDRSDLDALNLRIVYPEISETARQLHAERAIDIAVKGLGGLPSMTLNQVLLMRGEQPVDGGNTFYFPNPSLGAQPWLSYDGGDTGDYTPLEMGGQQGGQDPAGGPTDNPDERKAKDKSKVPPPATPAGGSTPPAKPAAKKFIDVRSPGKRWLPYHMQIEGV